MRKAACVAALLAVFAIKPASAVLIDFESGDVSWPCHAYYNVYSASGVTFGSFPHPNPMRPMSGWPCVRLTPSANGTRGLQGYNPLQGALGLSANFQSFGGALEVGADLGIPAPLTNAAIRMEAFDAFGVLVGSGIAFLDSGSREQRLTVRSSVPIMRVEFNGYGNWFVLDNVSFEAAPVADVPVPGAVTLIAAGLALAGLRLHRAR